VLARRITQSGKELLHPERTWLGSHDATIQGRSLRLS
jgi:hypothetical protein